MVEDRFVGDWYTILMCGIPCSLQTRKKKEIPFLHVE